MFNRTVGMWKLFVKCRLGKQHKNTCKVVGGKCEILDLAQIKIHMENKKLKPWIVLESNTSCLSKSFTKGNIGRESKMEQDGRLTSCVSEIFLRNSSKFSSILSLKQMMGCATVARFTVPSTSNTRNQLVS